MSQRGGLGIEAGIIGGNDGQWIITSRAEQPACPPNQNLINLTVNLEENLSELQRAVVTALFCPEYKDEKAREILHIIQAESRGELLENADVSWACEITQMFQLLVKVADAHLTEEAIRTVLKPLESSITQILEECIHIFFKFKSYKDLRKCFLDWVNAKYTPDLKKACFTAKFIEKVSNLSATEFKKGDGSPLSTEEKFQAGEFIKKMVAELTLTVWMKLDQIVSLWDSKLDPKDLKITIAVTGTKCQMRGARRSLPGPESLHEWLKSYIPDIKTFQERERRTEKPDEQDFTSAWRRSEKKMPNQMEDVAHYINNSFKGLQLLGTPIEPENKDITLRRKRKLSTEDMVKQLVVDIVRELEMAQVRDEEDEKEADEESLTRASAHKF